MQDWLAELSHPLALVLLLLWACGIATIVATIIERVMP